MDTGKSLESRLISSFPISIGTSLALETLFPSRLEPHDEKRKIPEHVNPSNYQEAYFNLSTLFRNLTTSIDRVVFIQSSPEELASVLESEIDIINSLFLNEGKGLCIPVYYYITYDSLLKGKISKDVKIRPDKTDSQKIYKAKLIDTMKLLGDKLHFIHYDNTIKPRVKNSSLILTHIPYDLLSYKRFLHLDLLESNTGLLKTKNLWNTKYYPVGNLSLTNLPFLEKLLFIFGDRVLIQPYDIRLRRLICETAEKRRWTPMTTLEKVLLDLSLDIKEPYVLEFIRKI